MLRLWYLPVCALALAVATLSACAPRAPGQMAQEDRFIGRAGGESPGSPPVVSPVE